MHTRQEKTRLLSRARRIAGQIRAVESALQTEASCSDVLHALTAARGAMNSLIVEVLEDHVRSHVFAPNAKPGQRARATQELFSALQSYLR